MLDEKWMALLGALPGGGAAGRQGSGWVVGVWGGGRPGDTGQGVGRARQPGASCSARISLSLWTRSEAAGPSRATAAGYPGS